MAVAVFMVAVVAAEWEQLQEALLEQAVLLVPGVTVVLMQRMVGMEPHHQVVVAEQEVPQHLQVQAVLGA
jgi:hypothetical protein